MRPKSGLKFPRPLLKIKWQDKILVTKVLKKAGMQSIRAVLKLAQLRWTGHIIRMSDERLPKNYRWESALKVTRRNATTTDFDIPMES